MSPSHPGTPKNVLVFADTQSWMQTFVASSLRQLQIPFTLIHSGADLRQNQDVVLKHTHYIISWESSYRTGGALIQSLLDLTDRVNPREQVIILTQEPTQEDVIYFGELGVRKVLQVDKESDNLPNLVPRLQSMLEDSSMPMYSQWSQLINRIQNLPDDMDPNEARQLLQLVDTYTPKDIEESAQKFDAKGVLYFAAGENELAEDYWQRALQRNPKYHMAHRNYVNFLKKVNRLEEAVEHLLGLHQHNSKNIARIVDLGSVHQKLEKTETAEKYFQNALAKDKFCAGALNGLATIKFQRGELEESKKLLHRSAKAYEAAAMLNQKGIDLVMQNKFEEALEHYSRAQYVLPDQEKGPLLFYNMGLCYWRWNQPQKAREYVKIALIKNPAYDKAKALLEAIESISPSPEARKSA